MTFSKLVIAATISSAAAFAPSFVSQRQSLTALEMARKPFISGNWKLNPSTKAEAESLAAGIAAAITPDSPDADVAIFVPYVFIDAARAKAEGSPLIVGAEVSTQWMRPRLAPKL
jgi:Triosephosphate isomerase